MIFMARKVIVLAGIILLSLGILCFVIIGYLVESCSEQDDRFACDAMIIMTYLIPGFFLIGIIVTLVGAVIRKKEKIS